jgi:hypothetical protein
VRSDDTGRFHLHEQRTLQNHRQSMRLNLLGRILLAVALSSGVVWYLRDHQVRATEMHRTRAQP